MEKEVKLSERIRNIRIGLGYSQEFLAEKLGLTQQAYSNIEMHPEKSTLARLIEIAKVLNVDISTLIGGENVHTHKTT
jgi:transcriptional regulator with XRE-family HTH domain